MDRRLANSTNRQSSQSSIKAFGNSFSCGEYGARDLDLGEDDYEAMAAEAEAAAQEMISKRKKRDAAIDNLLEFECDKSLGSAVDTTKPTAIASHSLPREGTEFSPTQINHSRNSKNKRWEPQKIREDDGAAGNNEEQVMQGSEGSLSIGLQSKDTANSEQSGGPSNNSGNLKNSHISPQGSFDNSGGVGNNVTNIIQSEDKSGIVLASTQSGGPAAAIHINAPNVTINYIIEQKVESRAPLNAQGRGVSDMSADGDSFKVEIRAPLNAQGRGMSDMSADGDSFAHWPNDGSISHKDPSIDSSVKSRKENSGNGDRNLRMKSPDIKRNIRRDESPQTVDGDEVPKFVSPVSASAMPMKIERVRSGGTAEVRHQDLHPPSKYESDFNDSHTCTTASATASYSTTMSRNLPERNLVQERKEMTSSLKLSTGSQPYDLSEMLDELWNPANPRPNMPAKRNSRSTSKSPARSRASASKSPGRSREGSDSSGSGVYTAGFSSHEFNTSVYPGAFDGEDRGAAQGSKSGMSSLSQIGRRMTLDLPPASAKSEVDVRGIIRSGPEVKHSSSSWGGHVDQYDNEEVMRRLYNGGQSSYSAAESQRLAMEEDKARTSSWHSATKPRSSSRERSISSSSGNSSTISQGKSRYASETIRALSDGRVDYHNEASAPIQSMYEGRQANIQNGLEREEDKTRQNARSGPSSKPRSTSRGRSQEEDFARIDIWTSDEEETEYDDESMMCLLGSDDGMDTDFHKPMERGEYNPRKNLGEASKSASRGEARDVLLAKSAPQGRERNFNEADQWQSKSQGGGTNDEQGLPGEHHVTWSGEPPEEKSMRDLLATIPSESERSLSIYEDVSVDRSLERQPNRRDPGLKMGAIAEHGDGTSVTSSVPEYKIDSQISEFARNFVNQFSMEEDNKQKQQAENKQTDRGSLDYSSSISAREDGSDISTLEELSVASDPSRNQRASASGRTENKVGSKSASSKGPQQRINSKLTEKGHLHHGVNTHIEPLNQVRSKSMKARPQSGISIEEKQARTQGRSKSMQERPQRNHLSRYESQRTLPPSTRPLSHGRRNTCDSHANQMKYTIGDTLQSNNDIISDSHVETLLQLKDMDYVFVRRSGGRWKYSIVAEVNENEMKFVLDRKGSTKKIERSALLNNVRRLNYDECFERNQR